MPTVTITVRDDLPSPQPISGVVVGVYTPVGVFVTSGTTDGSGSLMFLLADGTYNLLFYKQGISILPKQPQQIVVSSIAFSNSFSVTAHVKTLPESPDPLRCRISGTLLGVDGLPVQDLRISFRPIADITILNSNLISTQSQVEVKPTEDGYFQFDLLRGVKYKAFLRGVTSFPLLGIEPAALNVIVPNLPALSLVNLLFPLPVSVLFSQDTISIPLSAGADSSATLGVIHYSDGSTNQTGSRTQIPPYVKLDYDYSDPELFSIILATSSTQVTPYQMGTGTVQLTRSIPEAVYWLNPPSFASETLTVTIT